MPFSSSKTIFNNGLDLKSLDKLNTLFNSAIEIKSSTKNNDDLLKPNHNISENLCSVDVPIADLFSKPASQITYLCKDPSVESSSFMAIPHLGGHGTCNASFVSRVFERWLMDKTFIHDSTLYEDSSKTVLPFFGITDDELVDSFSSKLIDEINSNSAQSQIKVVISLKLGKTSWLAETSKDNSIQPVAQQFMFSYPLFLEVSVRDIASTKSSIKGVESNLVTPIGSISSHHSFDFDDVSDDFEDHKGVVSVTSHADFTEIRFFVNS